MKVISALICGSLVTAGLAFGQSKDADRVHVVSTAEIIKIDAKKKSLQVRELAQPTDTTGRRNGQGGGGYPGSGGRRGGIGGRRSGNIGFPGGGGGYPRRNPGTTTSQTKEYKVFVTKDTVMTLADTNIAFTDLRVGDRIDITGAPKGSKGDLEATLISRNLK
jgi:hypothetical protein